MSKQNRSISMAHIPRRSASLHSQFDPPPVKPMEVEGPVVVAMTKFYAILVRFMFTNQNDHVSRNLDKSPIGWLLHLLTFAGISWLTARRWSKWMVVGMALYNASVFFAQCTFLILLAIEFHITKVGEYQWVTVPFYVLALVQISSLWLNVRIHLLHRNAISEATCSYSINSDYVRRKTRVLRILCFLFLVLMALFLVGFLMAYKLSKDVFGIHSANNWSNVTVFSCGLFCDLMLYYVTFVSIVTIVGATGLFVLLASSVSMEARKLNSDICKYPSADGLDHLIYRYQSIEQSAYAIDKHFSCIIFGLLFVVVSGLIVLLRPYTRLMISEWETGAALFVFFYALACAMLVIFLLLGITLNDRLSEFRRASQKISDFQQIYTTNQNSIKLLSFMLRLCGTKEYLKLGGIFAINRQTIFILFLSLLVVGSLLFVVDAGCLQLF